MSKGFVDVARVVCNAIDEASDVEAFRELLKSLMGLPGRILSTNGSPRFPQFVLQTSLALGGERHAAAIAAAAVEFIIVAADVIDDMVDDDWPSNSSALEKPRAINATLALSCLAQLCSNKLTSCIGYRRAQFVSQLLAQGTIKACAGEDLDVLLEKTIDVSEESAFEMTMRKSGSLVAMACAAGAAVATDDPKVINTAGDFGRHVGVVAQLLNDLAGVDPETHLQSSDIRQKKKTLPISYALRCAQAEGLFEFLEQYEKVPQHQDADHEKELIRIIRDLGALHYTWLVAYCQRRMAVEALDALSQVSGQKKVFRLRRLIPKVRIIESSRKAQ